ncbi:hypothetical protein HCN44_008942 [Aphidius gifuensis]|uniref:Programmed cell death protein 2 C-terminal domain-containing protein n=1 Tax=Aphidius gifuensis TaxID=684658 RepID=A0A834XRN8_APHGI|nr:programmed cell death protein 2-like [Aphidius gifuensis]KAF7991571.1 hypothetical protein HCN44_008942 [Aphidius gifuensis]
MACKSKSKVYLGYEDGFVTDKYRSSVTFKTNKIGGKPNLSSKNVSLPSPICKLCGLHQLLAVQIYAPLDNSMYHRNLYVFACINPSCWNQHESWTCLRVQSLEDKLINKTGTISPSFTTSLSSATTWLSSADDWDIDENTSDDNTSNNINTNNNTNNNNNNNINNETINLDTKSCDNNNIAEDELTDDLTNMCFNDDSNTNSVTSIESPVCDGPVKCIKSLEASAEIEYEESETVFIDTPTQPQCNLIDLMQQVSTNVFKHHGSKSHTDLTFNEIFMIVDEEQVEEEEELSNNISQHVHDLIRKYQHVDQELNMKSSSQSSMGFEIKHSEKYEKSIPKHGDEMFHNFVERIKMNPGQLLRYCRDDSAPLLLSQLPMPIGSCKYCGHDRIFELQILPTIIPKLKLKNHNDFQLEFGTVLILTCSKSCWSLGDKYKEELVFLQAEKL